MLSRERQHKYSPGETENEKNAVRMWTYDPVLTDKKTSLHKHKMGARDSMLGYLISTCLNFVGRRGGRAGEGYHL